jgi:hypothetical protein
VFGFGVGEKATATGRSACATVFAKWAWVGRLCVPSLEAMK